MPPYDFDLVVVGGGPGGSTAAAFARRRGLSVLVAEKEQFPRFRIGESLLPKGNEIVREIGAWPRLAAAGFIQKFGAVFHLWNGQATKKIRFSESFAQVDPYAFQVERSKFDSLLLDHARELGAAVRMRTRVTRIDAAEGRHRVRLEGPEGEETVIARWVVDASGREGGDLFPEKRSFDPARSPKRVAIYNHFCGVPRAPGPEGGDTIAIRLEDGWFWFIPIDGERTSIGLVTTVEALRDSDLDPEAFFHRTVARCVKVRELFGQPAAVDRFRVTSDYTYFHRSLAGERMLLVGDAAGFFDPIFSSGVYMSMWSARLALTLIGRADAGGRGLTPGEQRRYSRAVKRHAGIFQHLIDAFYDNDSFAVFMSSSPLGIRAAMCSIVAGHTSLTWSLWWRFRAFLFVCWLQRRRIRVCHPLDYSSPALRPA